MTDTRSPLSAVEDNASVWSPLDGSWNNSSGHFEVALFPETVDESKIPKVRTMNTSQLKNVPQPERRKLACDLGQ